MFVFKSQFSVPFISSVGFLAARPAARLTLENHRHEMFTVRSASARFRAEREEHGELVSGSKALKA